MGGNDLNLIIPIAQATDGNHTWDFRDKEASLGLSCLWIYEFSIHLVLFSPIKESDRQLIAHEKAISKLYFEEIGK